MDKEYLEKNGVDVKSGLELLGDMDMYNETMEDYLKELSENFKKLKDFKTKEDMENYSIVVHSIKSDSKYLGFKNLAELALNHELKSKENDKDYVNNNFESLEKEINKTLDIAKKYLGKE